MDVVDLDHDHSHDHENGEEDKEVNDDVEDIGLNEVDKKKTVRKPLYELKNKGQR